MKKNLTILFLCLAFISNAQSVSITSSATGAICAGASVTFTATAIGFTSPTYQWYKNGTAISGANASTYTTSVLVNNDVINVALVEGGASVSTTGLVLNLDAGNSSSYTSGATTWTDLTGKGNHGTLNNVTYSSSNQGYLSFNGTTSYVSLPNSTDFNFGTGDFTIELWAQNSSATKTPNLLAINSNNSFYSAVRIGWAPDINGNPTMTFGHSTTGNSWSVQTGYTGSFSNWTQIVISRTAGVVTMYANGVNKGTYNLAGSLMTTTTSDPINNQIGTLPNYQSIYTLLGNMSIVRYYKAAGLTSSQVISNYNAICSRYGLSAIGTTSNSITATVTPGPNAPSITIVGDGCINKTSLTTTSGLTSYTWYKDNVAISEATNNSYNPTAAGDYKVTVSNGTCSTASAATTIYTCGVTADGSMSPILTTLVSNEGGINFGTGVSELGTTVNATGISTTLGTIGATTAVVGGVISSTNARTTSIGVIYSTDSNFGTFSTSSTQSNVASGAYAFTLSGLSSTTPYYAKSFIVNKAGTSYGAVISFTTLAVVPTLAATTAASAIAGTTATSGGNVSADGGSAVTARGIVWGTATNPTIDLTTKTTDGTGTGVFTSSLTGLTAATLYYVRSYATNAIGTSYGAEISFTTLDVVSTVTSPYTNKVWMDRNLGATRVAQSVNDTEAYGDLYQWGRAKDGGQLRNAPQVATRLTDISSRSTNSISAQPWTSQANWNSQTGGVWDVKPWNSNTDGGVNNPCPTGFRVPSDSEWTAELNGMIGAGLVTTTTGVFNSFLKIPQAGVIEGHGFSGTVITTKSVYWTTDRLDGNSSREIRFSPSLNAERNANWYSFRYSVRCITK